ALDGINALSAPMSIYEVHLGSWRRKGDNEWLTYRELAEQLPAYARDMGFTHLEFLPVSEHPFDGSWGYQPTGLYAPTSRFGTPEDFAALVDACHREGVGVLLDWVPGHFPDDPHGLGSFDGTALYEHANPLQGRHLDWGTLNYISKDPIHRKHHHGDILFGLHYAFSENFILPLSHDEVVHGKRSILGRMPGDEWQRFANLRAYYSFMFGHPGKKLLFMGAELAQSREWNHDQSLDWHLLEYKSHSGIQALIRDLNRLYRAVPALHQMDCDQAGFEWVITDDANRNVFAWLRKGIDEHARCLVIVNFSPNVYRNYRVRVPFAGKWKEVLNSDSAHYGGSNVGNIGEVQATGGELRLTVPPLAAIFL